MDILQQTVKAEQESNEEKKKEISNLQRKLSVDKLINETEKRRDVTLQMKY